MNPYLEKIARTEEEQESRKLSMGQIAGAVVGGSAAGHLVSAPMNSLSNRAIKSEINSTTPEIKKEHLRKMLRNNPSTNVTFNLDRTSAQKPGGKPSWLAAVMKGQSLNDMPHYNPIGNVSGTGKNYISGRGTSNTGILAHEIGHAVDYGKSSRGRTIGRVATRMGVPLVAGGAGLEMIRRDDEYTKYAPLTTVAAFAPILADETKANYHGYKELKRAGGKAPANKFLKRIASKNMLGYGGLAAAGAASTGVLTGTVQALRQRNQNAAKKESEKPDKFF